MFSQHWSLVRLGDIVTDMQPGFAQRPNQGDSGIPQIRTHNITQSGELSLANLKFVSPSDKEVDKYCLHKGDIVFNNTNSEDWVGKTALFDLDTPLLFSNHMTRIRVNTEIVESEFLARYLHFLWRSGFSKTRAKRWVSQAAIDQRELASFKVPLPTVPEQQYIVEILKHAESLCRHRQEILEQIKLLPAVLFLEMFGDPNPKINQRWDIETLGKIAQIQTGGTPNREKSEFYNGDIPWVKSTELVDGRIRRTEETIADIALARSNAKLFPVGTVLLAMYGQGQTRGRTGLLEIAAACNQACAAILPNDELLPEYIFVWFQCSYERIRALGRGGQQENLNLNIVRTLKIPKPPIEIQKRFCETLLYWEEIKTKSNKEAEQYDKLLNYMLQVAFSGKLTNLWREKHLRELDAWSREHNQNLKKKKTHILLKESTLSERPIPVGHSRRWLMDQLSEVQFHVYEALREWKDILIPSEDLDRFLEEWPIEHLEDKHNHVLCALEQLAGLGMIARVSVPNQIGDYATAYRVLREGELSKADDLKRLEVLE